MKGARKFRPSLKGRIEFLSMRPSILFPLFAETRTLPGVGPKVEKLIARVAGPRLIDAEEGRIATFTLNVLDHLPRRDPRQPNRVRCSDDSATIELVFFHANVDYLARALPVRTQRLVSGRIERFG